MMIDTEQYSFQLILHSGNARSTAYEALQLVRSNAFKEGEKKLSIAKEEMVEAQKLHAKLLRIMANQEGELDMNLLLIHAEDHIASSSIAVEMSGELIELYERMENYER